MPNKKEVVLFYILSLTWGIIFTLVGLFVFLYITMFRKDEYIVKSVAGRIALISKGSQFGGISLGIVYINASHNSERTHLHELGHTVQNMYFGPLFLFLVAIPSAIRYWFRRLKIKKYGASILKTMPHYDDVWFEGQATRLGYKHFKVSVNKLLEVNE
jgi:hypothetical protein